MAGLSVLYKFSENLLYSLSLKFPLWRAEQKVGERGEIERKIFEFSPQAKVWEELEFFKPWDFLHFQLDKDHQITDKKKLFLQGPKKRFPGGLS